MVIVRYNYCRYSCLSHVARRKSRIRLLTSHNLFILYMVVLFCPNFMAVEPTHTDVPCLVTSCILMTVQTYYLGALLRLVTHCLDLWPVLFLFGTIQYILFIKPQLFWYSTPCLYSFFLIVPYSIQLQFMLFYTLQYCMQKLWK